MAEKGSQKIKIETNFKFVDEVEKTRDILNKLVETNIDSLKPEKPDDVDYNPAEETMGEYVADAAKNSAIKLLDGLKDLAQTVLVDGPLDVVSNIANVAQTATIGVSKVVNPYFEIGKSLTSMMTTTKAITMAAADKKNGLTDLLNLLDKGLDAYIKDLDQIATQIDKGTKAVESLDYPYSEKGKDDIVKMIMASDAMSNMFDVFFVFENDDSQGPQSLPVMTTVPEVYNKNALTPTILSTRIKSISIPGIEKGTTSIQFCGSTIEKPDNNMNDPHQASFEVLADDSLYYIRMFNKIAGTDFSGLEEWNTLANKQLKQLLGEDARIVTGEMSNMYNSQMDKLFDTSRGKLSIYVKRLYHMPVQNIIREDKSLFTNQGFQPNVPRGFKGKKGPVENEFPNMMDFMSTSDSEKNLYAATGYYMPVYFKFTDVKILGTGTSISFKREGANTQSFSYDFIYRQCLALEGK